MQNQKINEMFNKVASFQEQLNQIDKEFRDMEGMKDDNAYSSPFHRAYDLERKAIEIRSDLIKYLVEKFRRQYCRNVTISTDQIKKLLDEKGELFFDADFIEQRIKEISKDAIKLSLDEIHNEAKKLLPSLWENYQRREPTEADILEGRSLVLKKWVSDYGYSGSHNYHLSSVEDIKAFEKLIKIVLYEADPATVETGAIFRMPYSGEEIFGVKEGFGKVEKYQLFKNGKFKVTFTTEDDAKRVLAVLLHGWHSIPIEIKIPEVV